MKVSRRALLRAGCATALFPWVRQAFAQTPPPPKLVLLMQTSGTHQSSFWPGAGFTPSPLLQPLLGVDELRRRTTVIKGLFNHAPGMGNEHDRGFAGLWSGKATQGTFDDPWGDGPSIDQQLKSKLSFTEPWPTLNTGVLTSSAPLFKPHRASFSYLGPKQQIPCQIDPWRLYATVFASSLGGADAQQRLAQKRSVLDFVREDLRALKVGLPSADRSRLEAHESALRAYELRLGSTVVGCKAPALPARLDLTDEANVPALVTLMFDFIALALSCGLTRIVTFQFGQCGERWRFGWLGINMNSHDDIFHRDTDDGTRPDIAAWDVQINQWYADQVASFAQRLNALPGSTGTLLDDSLVVWGNEMGTGPHGMDNIPTVLLGGAGGRLTTGRLVDAGPQTYHRLGTSVLNLYGVPSAGFGEEPACGPISGL